MLRRKGKSARPSRVLLLPLGNLLGKNTTLGDDDVTQKLVQLLVVTDGELKVTGNDTRLLVVTGGVSSKLEDLGCEVLKDSSEVDCTT